MTDAIIYSKEYPKGQLTEIAEPAPGTVTFAQDNATGKVKATTKVKKADR
jgi:hypothetical protein